MNSMADKKAAKREKMMNMPSYRLMGGCKLNCVKACS